MPYVRLAAVDGEPPDPQEGDLRYLSSQGRFEWYDGSMWRFPMPNQSHVASAHASNSNYETVLFSVLTPVAI